MEKKFTSDMVDDYAEKLLIGLTRDENKMVLDEFDELDKDLDEAINSIPNLDKVEPMSWCLDRAIDELRSDVVEESVPIDDLLANASLTSGDAIEVPKVVG